MREFDGGDSGDGLGCDGGCSFVFGAEGEETWVLDGVSCFSRESEPSLSEVLLTLGFLAGFKLSAHKVLATSIRQTTYTSSQGVLDSKTCSISHQVVRTLIR